MFWNKPTANIYKVVEVSPVQRLEPLSKELADSIMTLNSHPGFVYLMAKLAAYNAALRAKLTGERHTDLKDVQFLQAGIYWSNFLKNELATAARRTYEKQLSPYDEELEAFKKIDDMIERVGQPTESSS